MLSMRERRGAPDPEASAVSLRRDHAALARRYGRLARVAYGAALAALASAVVLWALGVTTTAEPLFRVLIVATLVFAVTGAMVAKLAESAAARAAKVVIRRTSQPRREGADRES